MKKTRRIVQAIVLSVTLIGVFALGANCERWCPFGGVEALYTYTTQGNMLCSLGVSNFYILGGVVVMTLLLRRAFCSYMCPIGTISEWLGAGAARLGIRQVRVPAGLDRALSLLKYVVLGLILYFTWRAGELIFRGFDPCYALISRHGTDITFWAYVVAGAIVLASLAVLFPVCLWFCPMAALLHLFSRFGLTRVQRDGEACGDCGLCARACPMSIPVDRLDRVTLARCTSCLNCVEACPQKKQGTLRWGPPALLGRRWSQGILVALLFLCTSGAVAASYLFPLPSYVKMHGGPLANPSRAELRVENLSCRGRANLLFYYLERDDEYAIPGDFRVEAWPGPGVVDVHVFHDPAVADEEMIKQAVTEPYYDAVQNLWRESPFRIEGYDPLGLDLP